MRPKWISAMSDRAVGELLAGGGAMYTVGLLTATEPAVRAAGRQVVIAELVAIGVLLLLAGLLYHPAAAPEPFLDYIARCVVAGLVVLLVLIAWPSAGWVLQAASLIVPTGLVIAVATSSLRLVDAAYQGRGTRQ